MIKILKLLCFFQFTFLVIAGVDFYVSSNIDTIVKVFISSMLIVDGLLYIVCMFVLRANSSYVRIMFSTFVLVNGLLTFADEVGVWDIVILTINIFILRLYYHIHKDKKDEIT